MKKLMASAAALALLVPAMSLAAPAGAKKPAKAPAKAAKPAATPAPKDSGLTTDKQKLSYVIGFSVGSGLRREGGDKNVDVDVLARGLRAALAGQKPALTDDEMQRVVEAYRTERMKEAAAKMKATADKNKADGEKYLAENKKKEGIVTLPSGLQYKIVAPGNGASPKATDTVKVNYRGTLIDGTEFDSSQANGGPVTFPVNQVIAGWTEALQLMKVGAKWQLFVPAELAYKDQPAGPKIGPNSTLIFDVELLSIEKPEPEKPAGAGDKPAGK